MKKRWRLVILFAAARADSLLKQPDGVQSSWFRLVIMVSRLQSHCSFLHLLCYWCSWMHRSLMCPYIVQFKA